MKASELRACERLYRRRIPSDAPFTHELCTELARLSHATGIQLGVLIDRSGGIEYVIAGDGSGLDIPKLERRRSHYGRLQGLRLIHTHFGTTGLSSEDLTDLARLRLDMIYAVTVDEAGRPDLAHGAYLSPDGPSTLAWKLLEPVPTYRSDIPFGTFISDLEEAIGRMHPAKQVVGGDRAILVAVATGAADETAVNLAELEDLARSAGITVLETVTQRRPKPDPRYVVGQGKLREIYIKALALDANLIVFDHELSPSQARSISDLVDMRVVDRTQVILDIFAKRARTMEGKIQVELAQLKYNMPRLVGRNPALSRLAGGIGTKGPGETKLEIDRRRAKERVARLEQETARISAKRELTRRKRRERKIPVISIIGYTNTGKSTLLNALTHSHVLAADMPFATLDPSSKRLRFPREIEVIITDTVGFIRDLPDDLKAAFMATLEELGEADLLLEVIDVSDPNLDYRMQAVTDILSGLNLQDKPRLRVFNKADRCDPALAGELARRYDGVLISALNPATLTPLIERMQGFFLE